MGIGDSHGENLEYSDVHNTRYICSSQPDITCNRRRHPPVLRASTIKMLIPHVRASDIHMFIKCNLIVLVYTGFLYSKTSYRNVTGSDHRLPIVSDSNIQMLIKHILVVPTIPDFVCLNIMRQCYIWCVNI